jgi:hypothetical protein
LPWRKGVPHSVAAKTCFRIEKNLKPMEIMSILKRTLILAGCVAALGLGTATLMAGRGAGGGGAGGFGGGRGGGAAANLATYREAMGVTDDAEWAAISAAITKVTTTRAAAMPFAGGRGGRGGRGGAGAAGGAPAAAPAAPATSDAMQALQKAYDDKAPAADIKAAIAKVLAENKANEAAYIAAQNDLRKLLTASREAYLTLQRVLISQ